MKPVKFGDLFDLIRNGFTIRQTTEQVGVPLTRIETISEGTIDPQRVGYAGILEPPPAWLLQPDDILFSHINSVKHIGKCAIYKGEPAQLLHGMNLLLLRPNKTVADPDYLKHLIRSQYFRRKVEKIIKPAVNQASVSIGHLREIDLTMPSLREQQRVAAALNRVESLKVALTRSLNAIDEIMFAVFVEMFGDPVSNDLNLPLVCLGDLGAWHSGGTPPRSNERFFTGNIPWFTSGELNDVFVDDSIEHINQIALQETAVKRVRRGSLMLGMYDTAALKGSIAAIDCSCNQAIAFAEIDAVLASTLYVYFAIRIGRERFRARQRGIRQKNLNLTMIRAITIPLATRSAQETFEEIVRKWLVARGKRLRAITTAQELHTALDRTTFCEKAAITQAVADINVAV